MVAEPSQGHLREEGGCAHMRRGFRDGSRQLRPLDEQAHRRADEEGNECRVGVDRRAVRHAVALHDLHVAHDLLGQHRAQREGHVRKHGRVEPSPCEAEVRSGRHAHSQHDRKQGQDDGQRGCLAQDQVLEGHVKHGLQGLDRVRQGDGDRGEADLGGHVAYGVERPRYCERAKLLGREEAPERLLAQAYRPHHQAVHQAAGHVHGGQEQRVLEVAVHDLVLYVEDHVEGIPHEDEDEGHQPGREQPQKAPLLGLLPRRVRRRRAGDVGAAAAHRRGVRLPGHHHGGMPGGRRGPSRGVGPACSPEAAQARLRLGGQAPRDA
mmetsp:Transcript_13242/g.48230  ORF Transcript_13242/g.48230 Transcript_13242/m.48230 type:complete len:322 (+) Transcript_13242:407-1372(+)